MAERMQPAACVHRLARRMHTDDATAQAWVEAMPETLVETFKAGKSVTLLGFGGFSLARKRAGWAFKFNPGQKLRALFGWSSSYKGTV